MRKWKKNIKFYSTILFHAIIQLMSVFQLLLLLFLQCFHVVRRFDQFYTADKIHWRKNNAVLKYKTDNDSMSKTLVVCLCFFNQMQHIYTLTCTHRRTFLIIIQREILFHLLYCIQNRCISCQEEKMEIHILSTRLIRSSRSFFYMHRQPIHFDAATQI